MTDLTTARIGLAQLAAGQMQKHLTLNDTLNRLDALVQTRVESRLVATQPESPPEGALYILPPGASGAEWSTLPEGTLVRWEAGGWAVVDAPEGMIAVVAAPPELVLRADGAWVALGSRLGVVQDLERLGVGTSADDLNRFAACVNGALWSARGPSHGGSGDLRMRLQKEAASNDLVLGFQTADSGRAEFALVGDDALDLRVSADGLSWKTAWSVDCLTGRVLFEGGAQRRVVTVMTSSGSYSAPAWARTIEVVAVGGGGGGGAGFFGPSGARFGGGGGGAGCVNRGVWNAGDLGASVSVAVGVGGAGGSSGVGASGSGSAAYVGGTSVLIAPGGGGGGAGSATAGTAGLGGAGVPNSNGGGASSISGGAAAGKSFDRPDAPGGGGGGGGLDAAGAARAGGAGGDGGALAVKALGGAGGNSASGVAGAAAPQPALYWAGGGGGGGGANAGGAGHDGAPGGGAGAGGGGGGAGLTAGGSGGSGAAGVVWIIATG